MNDDELLAAVREAMTAMDPVPAEVVDRAHRALTWDVELAALLEEVESLATAGVRSATTVQDRTFESGDIELEVSISSGRIEGLVDPPSAMLSLVVPGREACSLDVDDSGRFAVEVDGLAAAIVVRSETGTTYRTPLLDLLPAI